MQNHHSQEVTAAPEAPEQRAGVPEHELQEEDNDEKAEGMEEDEDERQDLEMVGRAPKLTLAYVACCGTLSRLV